MPHCLYSFATPPDGLARTSANELARFLMSYAGGGMLDGRRLLQPGTISLMLSDHLPGIPLTGWMKPQGLAWHVEPMGDGGPFWGHLGGDPGVTTLMVLRPADGLGVVILTNARSVSTTLVGIARFIADAAGAPAR